MEQTDKTDNTSFDHFFKEQIDPVLNELDDKRRAIRAKGIWLGIGVGIGIVVGGVLLSAFTGTFLVIHSIYFGIFAGIGSALWYAQSHKRFLRTYKERVVAPIFERVHGSFSYDPMDGVPKEEVLATGLFDEPKAFASEDRVEGQFENTRVSISDIWLEWESGKHDDTARGVFFSADMYREATSPVFIQPHATGEVHSTVSGEKVDLESPDFEDAYDVRGDQLMARRILTPLVMEQLMTLKKRVASKTPFVVYRGTTVCMFIPTGRNLFEPRIFRGFSKKHIRQYAEDVQMFLDIVHTLNLNREIQQ